MKKNLFIAMILMTTLLFACGGGGGGGGSTPPPTQQAQPTTAVIKITSQGSPSSSPLAGIQVTVHLPAGVSVKSTQNPPQTNDGVVTASGNASGAELVIGTYSASDRTVTLSVIKSAGLAVGEFATVNCDIAAGSSPASGDFSVSNLKTFDTNGAAATGLSASLTATMN